MNDLQKRYWQIQRLVDKESHYLEDVAKRLFVEPTITAEWIDRLIESPEGRDRLEAFVGKFSRTQDTLIDKLLPHCLAAVGEKTGSALDNLNRAERLGLLDDPDRWLTMRHLRNRLVHEYVDNMADLAAALNLARSMVDTLLAAVKVLRGFAQAHFPEQPAG
jgi:uncharacterized protein with HEPN domain